MDAQLSNYKEIGIMSGSISADTIIGSNKTVNVNTLQQVSDVTAAVNGRSGSAGAFSFRNKIVDGRFDFWYEGITSTADGFGAATMWWNTNIYSTKVVTRQPLTAGVDLPAIDCPTAKYFQRTVVTSVPNSWSAINMFQKMEDASLLAGKTVTVSFYAKADSAKNIAVEAYQTFGSGGTPSDDVLIPMKLITLTSSWAKYTATINIPSVTGKTFGTNNNTALALVFWFDAGANFSGRTLGLGQQSGTFDIACIQLEEGSVATPFEELPIEVSKVRLSRYFRAFTSDSGVYWGYIGIGYFELSNTFRLAIPNTFRTLPMMVLRGNLELEGNGGIVTAIGDIGLQSNETIRVGFTSASAVTPGYSAALRFANDATAALFFDARL